MLRKKNGSSTEFANDYKGLAASNLVSVLEELIWAGTHRGNAIKVTAGVVKMHATSLRSSQAT